MTLSDVKKGLIGKMKQVFPTSKYKYYSMGVVEGYKRPCFFTQLKPIDTSPSNYNTRMMKATLYIDYMQDKVDEADVLDVIQMLQDAFELAVPVQDGEKTRYVHITDMSWDFIGTDRNIPEITVDLEWGASITRNKPTAPIMEGAEINYIMEE